MKLSIVTPVVTMLPAEHARWEGTGTIADVARIAEAAERLGYDNLTCSEHVAVPVEVAATRGARYWDPLATFGYLAARTERIRFATNVLVLGYHHPLAIAKRYGTLDMISGGRLILGVGVGTLQEEFELLGAPFAGRGELADDAMRALRASLSEGEPSYHGDHYSYDGFIVDPCAVQARVPLWVGGRTLLSLRRAATLGDGWAPFAVSSKQAAEWLGQVDAPAGFEVVLRPGRPLDPSGQPDVSAEVLGKLAAGGATITAATFVHHSVEHYLEQLEALVAVNAAL